MTQFVVLKDDPKVVRTLGETGGVDTGWLEHTRRQGLAADGEWRTGTQHVFIFTPNNLVFFGRLSP